MLRRLFGVVKPSLQQRSFKATKSLYTFIQLFDVCKNVLIQSSVIFAIIFNNFIKHLAGMC